MCFCKKPSATFKSFTRFSVSIVWPNYLSSFNKRCTHSFSCKKEESIQVGNMGWNWTYNTFTTYIRTVAKLVILPYMMKEKWYRIKFTDFFLYFLIVFLWNRRFNEILFEQFHYFLCPYDETIHTHMHIHLYSHTHTHTYIYIHFSWCL